MENPRSSNGTKRSAESYDPEVRPVQRENTSKKRNSSEPKRSSSKLQRPRPHRLLCGKTPSQKTLTQIKFVPRPSMVDDDDVDLNYIGGPAENSKKDNTAGRSRKRRSRGERYTNMDRADETLTQMDWMRPPATTTPLQERTQTPPRKGRTSHRERRPSSVPQRELRSGRKTRKRPISELDTIEEEHEQETCHDVSDRSKRTKRSHSPSNNMESAVIDLASTGDGSDKENAVLQDPDVHTQVDTLQDAEGRPRVKPKAPVTPQKRLKRVIPSSQSPESPEITLAEEEVSLQNPSQRPLGDISHNTRRRTGPVKWENDFRPSPKIKKRLSPILQNMRADAPPVTECKSQPVAQQIEAGSYENHLGNVQIAVPSRLDSTSPTQARSSANKANETHNSILESRASRERVINDSDEDPHLEEDVFSQLSDAEINRPQEQKSQHCAGHKGTQTVPEAEDHSDPSEDMRHSTLGSDLSILYCRRPMDSHYGPPNHDFPSMSSAGLAELFATQGEATYRGHHTEDGEDFPTELVPESSPPQPDLASNAAVADAGNDDENGPPSSPIILVESSQPLSTTHNPQQQESGPQEGLLTASQLLTESLMESIPGPPGWMSSQNYDLQEEMTSVPCERH